MNEDLVLFGQEHSLVGILTTGETDPPGGVGCLLPNIGLAHRIGPHRLTVKVARSLSAHGFTSLRFDVSGIGDSPKTKNSSDVIEQAVKDMRSAMDCMHQRLGITRFVVFGICSGAQNGYFLSLRDERIVGVLMYDGFEFPSRLSKLMHRVQRFQQTPWKQLLGKVRERLSDRSPRAATTDIFAAALQEMHPTRAEFERAMNQLVARGVSIYVVFSGSRRAVDVGRGLFGAFGRAAFFRGITYRFEGDLDHTATSLASQRKLLTMVSEWTLSVAKAQGKPINRSTLPVTEHLPNLA